MGDDKQSEPPKSPEPEPKKPGRWKRFFNAALEYGLEYLAKSRSS